MKGQQVTIKEHVDGWWRGECNGKEGVFPSNVSTTLSDGSRTGSHASAETISNVNGNPMAVCQNYTKSAADAVKPTKAFNYGAPKGGIGSLFPGGVPQLKKTGSKNIDAADAAQAVSNVAAALAASPAQASAPRKLKTASAGSPVMVGARRTLICRR